MEVNIAQAINQYLQLGGTFTPELAIHQAVRVALIRCRDELQKRKTDPADRAIDRTSEKTNKE